MRENVKLAPLTTFKIGGRARYFFEVKTRDELKEAVGFAKSYNLPTFVLGGGSNVLISDSGFNGVVIKTALQGVTYKEDKSNFLIEVEAGENWDNLVEETVNKNITGFENLAGIPGSVGATPVQNIGAYGKEIAPYIASLEVYDTDTEEIKKLNNNECQFSYRESIFKKGGGKDFIITRVNFKLPKNEPLNISYNDLQTYFKEKQTPSIYEVREAVIEIRKNKFPDLKIVGTAGSFFKNPIIKKRKATELKKQYPKLPVFPINNDLSKVSGAYLVDKVANLKGEGVGGACVWKDQALVIVNDKNGTSNNVLKLAEKIKKEIFKKTGIILYEEIKYIF